MRYWGYKYHKTAKSIKKMLTSCIFKATHRANRSSEPKTPKHFLNKTKWDLSYTLKYFAQTATTLLTL